MSTSIVTEAIILKRINVGEVDRLVTLLTPGQGKVRCVAKGVRKLSSSQGSSLEPGNHVTVQLIQTKSLALLTQTRLIENFPTARVGLARLKKMLEILEFVDVLAVEEMADEQLFGRILGVLELLNSSTQEFQKIQQELSQTLVELGYQELSETPYTSVLEYVTSVAERPLRSYDFLTVK